jgi:hypothetical protein
MPKSTDNPPNLFRSSPQNDAEHRSTNSLAVSDAEGRWPLLKAMPPKEPQPTPQLTGQELQHWQPMESNDKARPVTPRAPPGLGDLLALGLKHMSKRASAKPRIQISRSQPNVVTSTQPTNQAYVVPTELQVAPPTIVPEVKIAEPEVTLQAIFNSKKPAVEQTVHDHVPADDSLKGVFSRLDGSKKQTESSLNAEKRPSYLGRLSRK